MTTNDWKNSKHDHPEIGKTYQVGLIHAPVATYLGSEMWDVKGKVEQHIWMWWRPISDNQ